ncbi:MAG: hypothetical protein MJ200_05340 [Mycoplasmoidaceae bacterium]|nr:hypothetical protein [Mycoplasmoidaceae bacterium]
MAEISGFFNSVNNDRVYDATDVARFLKKFFTNGVFNNSLQVVANDNMTVSVSVGQANIEGYSYELNAVKTLDISDADSTLSRIDSVILRLDLSNRQITVQILEGSTATEPSQPNIVRSGNIYDLRLANILIPAESTRITSEMITDTRFTSDCGNVTQAVLSLDTHNIFKQYEVMFNNWFSGLQVVLDGDVAGHLQDEIFNMRTAMGIEIDTYNSSIIYNVGDIVVKNHKVYECIEDNVTGTFDISKWNFIPILVSDEAGDE